MALHQVTSPGTHQPLPCQMRRVEPFVEAVIGQFEDINGVGVHPVVNAVAVSVVKPVCIGIFECVDGVLVVVRVQVEGGEQLGQVVAAR